METRGWPRRNEGKGAGYCSKWKRPVSLRHQDSEDKDGAEPTQEIASSHEIVPGSGLLPFLPCGTSA